MKTAQPRALPVFPVYLSAIITFLVLRIVFLVYNSEHIHADSFSLLVTAFANGFLIDSSVTATILIVLTAIFLLAQLLLRRALHRSYCVAATAVLAITFLVNLVDVFYFAFFNSRLNLLFFQNTGQMGPIVETIVNDYPIWFLAVLWIMAVGLFVLLVRSISKILNPPLFGRHLAVYSVLALVVLFIVSFLWTGEPFWRMNRFSLKNQGLSQLSLNGVYTLAKAYDQKRIIECDAGEVDYQFQAVETAIDQVQRAIFTQDEIPTSDPFPFTRHLAYPLKLKVARSNVVVILMEGFSASYVGTLNANGIGNTPGFDTLAQQAWLFTRFYSQSTRTHHGLVSTVGSFPSLLNMFLTRRRGTESFYTLGNLFQDYGYSTSFIYGYDPGFDHMGFFLKQGGIDTMIDREAFPDPVFESEWGVSDEDLFDKANEYLAQVEKPFFCIILTSSNHSPHKTPPHFIEENPWYAGHSREAAFAYADHCLAQFLADASRESYFNNTVFVVLADHGEILDTLDRNFKRFHIPCMFYSPNLLGQPRRIETIGSQVDIGTTLMHLIGYPGVFHCLGRNLLSLQPDEGWAVMRDDHTVYYYRNDMVLVRDMRDTVAALYRLDDRLRLLTRNEIDADSTKTKFNDALEAYLQVTYYLYTTGKHRYIGVQPLFPLSR